MRSSKESLKILFDNACNDKEGFIPLMNESYLNVEKDLEVLGIIKGKLMWVENDKIYIGLQNDTYIELTEEDFNYDDRYIILKEWLEYDK